VALQPEHFPASWLDLSYRLSPVPRSGPSPSGGLFFLVRCFFRLVFFFLSEGPFLLISLFFHFWIRVPLSLMTYRAAPRPGSLFWLDAFFPFSLLRGSRNRLVSFNLFVFLLVHPLDLPEFQNYIVLRCELPFFFSRSSPCPFGKRSFFATSVERGLTGNASPHPSS